MKKIFIIVIASILYFSNAFAVTLLDALNQTYQNNIQLNAERENIKASEEDVNIAKSDYKPSLTISGSQSFEDTNKLTNQGGGDAAVTDVDPFTTSIKLEQTLVDFGRNAEYKKKQIGIDLAESKFVFWLTVEFAQDANDHALDGEIALTNKDGFHIRMRGLQSYSTVLAIKPFQSCSVIINQRHNCFSIFSNVTPFNNHIVSVLYVIVDH